MITHEALNDAGYRRYEATFHRGREFTNQRFNHADAMYQRKIMDGADILFFINIYWYDCRGKEMGKPDGWQPEVQFNSNGPTTFGTTLFPDEMSVGEVEAFFLKMYKSMGCEPYEKSEAA